MKKSVFSGQGVTDVRLHRKHRALYRSNIIVITFIVLFSASTNVFSDENKPTVKINMPAQAQFLAKNSFFKVSVSVSDLTNLKYADFILKYNPYVLQVWDTEKDVAVTEITAKRLLPKQLVNVVDNKKGFIRFVAFTSFKNGVVGNGILADITFKVVGSGNSEMVFREDSKFLTASGTGDSLAMAMVEFKTSEIDVEENNGSEINGR